MSETQLPGITEDHHGPLATLRDIETTLLALCEIDPADLNPELRKEYERDLLEAIRKAPEKRERVAMKLFDKGQRVAILRAKAQYLKDRAKEVDAAADREEADIERLKDYVLDVMRELPEPKKGKTRILEGTSATFKAAKVAASVEIFDEAALPERFKTVTVTMPAELWEKVIDACAALFSMKRLVASWGRVDKKIIKAELEQPCEKCKGDPEFRSWTMDGNMVPCLGCQGSLTQQIPGARLVKDKLRLIVE